MAPFNKWSFAKHPGFMLVAAFVLFLSANVIADKFFRGVSADLTADGLYTLSEGTTAIVRSLDEPVSLKFYFSKKLSAPYPGLLSYGRRVEDLLKSLAARSPGQINLTVIDPEPFSEAEDQAVAGGLTGVPLGDGSTIYMGLVASNALDREAVIPFFSEERETFLEYDLAKMLQGLVTAIKPRLVLLTDLPMQFGIGGPQAFLEGRSRPYVLYNQLKEVFDLQEITSDFDQLPEETDVLMLVHPPVMSDDQLYQIDQFVLGGGKLLAFLDPFSETLAAGPGASKSNSAANLGPLLAAWGLEISENQIVGDAAQAQRVSTGGIGPDAVKDFIFWIGASADNLDTSDIVTGKLDTINFASAGVLVDLKREGLSVSPLVTTSKVSMLYAGEQAAGTPDPDALLRALVPDGVRHILSARVTGRALSAFPEYVSSEAGLPSALGFTGGDIHVVVTSDADIFEDRFWVQVQELFGERLTVPIASNGSFILNLADHISGSDALLTLRGRGLQKRPFDVVDKLRRDAESRFLAEEERLQQEMVATEARLVELENASAERGIFNHAQEEAAEEFRQSLIETRRALREVKRNLRRDIDVLGNILAAINIFAIPFLVVIFGLLRYWKSARLNSRQFGIGQSRSDLN